MTEVAFLLPPSETTYKKGCKCAQCRAAASAARARRRRSGRSADAERRRYLRRWWLERFSRDEIACMAAAVSDALSSVQVIHRGPEPNLTGIGAQGRKEVSS